MKRSSYRENEAGLSVRHARGLQTEPIHDGVPTTAIEMHGFSETHPLVVTGPNTREPENRHVEVVLR